MALGMAKIALFILTWFLWNGDATVHLPAGPVKPEAWAECSAKADAANAEAATGQWYACLDAGDQPTPGAKAYQEHR